MSMLHDTSSMGIGCPDNGVQFDKVRLQGCAKYALSAAIFTWLMVFRRWKG